ncbi:MAG TPA: TonB-dependent receptor [Selenomonadales bacterium]|nr:TonB-dependent receptor [Selenomonadales bacterium]
MIKSKKLRRAVSSALAFGLSWSIAGTSWAEEQTEFTFDPITVTAMRKQSTDLKTPAYVNVYNEEKLKATGASNLLDALKFTEGITYDGYGAQGHLYSTMTARAVIRGMDRGTVVLLDGVPTNLSGYYALEHIPLDNIEKVEVVKGASSVLYGTAAMGGVINIITKKKLENSVSLEQGSFDTKRQALSLQMDKLSLSLGHSETGDLGQISDPYPATGSTRRYTAYRGDNRDFVRWSWAISDNITLTHQHDVDDFDVDRNNYTGTLFERIAQKETKDSVILQVDQGPWTSKFYGNTLSRDYRKYSSRGVKNTDTVAKYGTYGLDSQTSWTTPYGQYTAGMAWQKDWFKSDDKLKPAATSTSYVARKERDFYSLFGQVNHPLSAKTNLIVGARQEFIEQKGADDYSEFCPQLQLLTAINPEQVWYINVGRAFRMPSLSDMYGSTWRKTANPNLSPEYGYNYEIGWKKVRESSSLKVALFYMDFTNYIQWKQNSDDSYSPYNTEFRNLGAEAGYEHKLSNKWTYNVGVSVSNPQEKEEGADWKLSLARLQFTGGIQYRCEKWSANLSASYLGDRKDDLRPTLPVNAEIKYRASETTDVKLRMENVLDRNDIVSNGSSYYRALPRTYYFGVTNRF